MVMDSQHFDIGTIQAFLDGELSHERVDQVSSHIAACDSCALMLSEAEDESAIVFPALEREFDTLVPTHRLWSRINDSIAIERENVPFWKKAFAFVSVAFASPSLTAAAGLVLVFGLVTIFWVNRTVPSNDVAYVAPAKTASPVTVDTAPSAAPSAKPQMGDTVSTSLQDMPKVERASYRPEPQRAVVSQAVVRTNSAAGNAPNADGLPGEESYIKTIATLAKSVESQKDETMRPSERVAYERDMAVVNDSIAKMRQEVKKNPKNESAKQVLYTSYQNKIDLLNSVSQKEELMASLNR